MLERYTHIIIEGPIGVGKTSLARKLADAIASHRPVRLQLETPQDNPFLERFYRDPMRYALHTQLSFLFQRIRQLQHPVTEGIPRYAELSPRSPLISDYLIEKDGLFAKLTLTADELTLYEQAWAHMASMLAPSPPDLVVYLQASPERLLERIARRAIPMETLITEAYLRALCTAYSDFFHHYTAAPLMIVNTDHLNPLDHEEDFTLLIERLHHMRGRKAFFNRGET